MKLLIAAEIFPPDIGGPATYTVKLASALVAEGWQVEVVCYSDIYHADKYDFTVHRIIRSKFKFLHYLNYYKKLKSLAKDHDVIYAMGPISSGRPALKVAKELNKKLVVKVVGDYAWESFRNFGESDVLLDEFQTKDFGGYKTKLLKKIERQVCQQADKIIVPSFYLKKIVSGWGVNDEKIAVVYNSTAINVLQVEPAEINKNIIISIARLVSWKGFKVLIKLMPELLTVNPDFRLKIFGNGPDKDKLNNLIQGLNLQNQVTINHVDREELLKNLSRSGIFVLNTGYEGLSHTILEALAAGVPVVTTNIGGNPELITDDENGLLVDYNSQEQIKTAILKIYRNEDLRHKFITNAKKELGNFTFDKMIKDTQYILENL